MADRANSSGQGGLRNWLNRNPFVVAAAVALVVLLTVYILFFGGGPAKSPEAFYSSDDGATWFADEARIAPFMKNGKETVVAHIFACADGKPFVGFLSRIGSEEGRRKAEERYKKQDPSIQVPDIEVKKPGTGEWVKMGGQIGMRAGASAAKERGASVDEGVKKMLSAEEITAVKCPNGAEARPYSPQDAAAAGK